MKKEELIEIVEKLKENKDLSDAEFLALLTTDEEEVRQHLFECADNVRRENRCLRPRTNWIFQLL